MSPELGRAAIRIGMFVALTSGVLVLTRPPGSAERAISLWMLLVAVGFLGGVVLLIRRS